MQLPFESENQVIGAHSLEKALDVLDVIGAAQDGISARDLAQRLTLPRTTLYRILASLTGRGMVRRDGPSRVYRLGFHHLELVRNAYLQPDLVAAASNELRSLRDLTGETSYLAVLNGTAVLSLERCEGAHELRSRASLGHGKPLHCTSQGKAILAAMSQSERDCILKKITLTALTRNTITDRRRLMAELELVDARGYAIDDEEVTMGTRCVGAAIVDGSGAVRGALSVAGPAYRLTQARIELLGTEVADAARRLGAQLDAGSRKDGNGPITAIRGPWAFHGAFPYWSPRRERLYWADTLAPAIHGSDGVKDEIIATLESPITGLLPHPDGLLIAQSTGWRIFRENDRTLAALSPWQEYVPEVFCAHPDGSLWASCGNRSEGWKVGVLQGDGRFIPHWSFDGPIVALAWNETGLYACSAESGTIFLMQRGHGQIRRFAVIPKGSGILSALALDKNGGVWVALCDGWGLVRLQPDGILSRLVSLPVPCPTGLAFGGKKRETLFITTSRQNLARDALVNAPRSGHLLRSQWNSSTGQ